MTTLILITHFAMSVEMFLGHSFLGQEIGHGGQHHRPLRFPNLKSLIFIFGGRGEGGHIQDLLYEQKVKELDTPICHFGCCDLCQG
jgi:predicted alpha/beta hydrolase